MMTPFAERVESYRAGTCRVHALKTSAKDIVTFRGSFRSCPDMATNEDLVQELTSMLLDKGTMHRDRFEVAEILDNLGAYISFFNDGLRVGFRGRTLKDDLPTVVELLAEQLIYPALDEDELSKVRARAIANVQRSLESTRDQASAALRRSIFPPNHPNYIIDPAEATAFYEGLDRDRVAGFHADHFGARNLEIVFVGDIPEGLAETVDAQLGDWSDHRSQDNFEPEAPAGKGGESFVEMADKPNADVAMGHPLAIRRNDAIFVPLYVGNYILGGNFSARLMSRIRDEMGLTYGIRSNLSGVTVEHGGLWEVSVTLSADNLDQGIEETRREVDRFVESGVTASELADKKTTITGSYQVGLGSTGGLARALLASIERGFGPSYLDTFPREVKEVGLDQVNDAIRAILKPDELFVATAGSRIPIGSTVAEGPIAPESRTSG